ncbi:MAG: Membrane protein insertase, YidC/Oxa1 family [Candidatus Kaiserbacteria bacterium GW2011_GWB1_52_6]|uniref:Membrane protein insertase, YidC/Oxa1 family n=3 Tax=Candidatus Kaiseribacteriota TaxID=1752734 RepID=A0A0G1XIU0_9BACT|nr:MAG: Membrane protein insertase, YidC/Oxa1 family [Candidatus Kaiserbacteria bacterium GW2011_GWA2_52_12]KKW27576.1 MAG: Membrane protein insertase, YidC/Oxa1 family [Candidatus Kaiserbacteria bacterium GW2011_GWB1_52_6]KKW30876.1 MAG: Membrane protein insertase, YidC/Oxa1 family [Candidatus Kaiserbacteria bacterium GW2011_GWC2_52_8b]
MPEHATLEAHYFCIIIVREVFNGVQYTNMISFIFHALVYDPLYNGLIYFVGMIPTHDVGVAVIVLTIVVRVILFPLSRRAVESQIAMKKIAPEIEELKKKHKDSGEQSKAIFALYKERNIHPFASIGLLLLQLPVLIGLYWVFALGGLPHINTDLLYSFVHAPAAINMEFMGIFDMGAKHNVILAILVALSQLIYSRLSMGPRGAQTAGEATLSTDMAKSFDVQARYVFPLLFGVISWTVPAAAPLYWLTGNLFMMGQEYISGRRF